VPNHLAKAIGCHFVVILLIPSCSLAQALQYWLSIDQPILCWTALFIPDSLHVLPVLQTVQPGLDGWNRPWMIAKCLKLQNISLQDWWKLVQKGYVTIDYNYQYKCGLTVQGHLQRYFVQFALDKGIGPMYYAVRSLRFTKLTLQHSARLEWLGRWVSAHTKQTEGISPLPSGFLSYLRRHWKQAGMTGRKQRPGTVKAWTWSKADQPKLDREAYLTINTSVAWAEYRDTGNDGSSRDDLPGIYKLTGRYWLRRVRSLLSTDGREAVWIGNRIWVGWKQDAHGV